MAQRNDSIYSKGGRGRAKAVEVEDYMRQMNIFAMKNIKFMKSLLYY